ncbi:MAG: hypothetical protein EA366_06405 [Spirulina sp. DLM2.Bin59]|nr:MAG: hypothetical protein EA366_06405 [Spirulina sp. DLM2.Bin59]
MYRIIEGLRPGNPRQRWLRSLGIWGAIALLSLSFTLAVSRPSAAQARSIQGTLAFTLTDLGGAEMLAVSANGQRAVVAGDQTISVVAIGRNNLRVEQTATLQAANFPAGSTAAEITGVAISPNGRYALAGVKDDDPANLDSFNEVPGKVVAYSLPDLQVLGEVTVGRGPDSVAIAPNGQFAAVANEDEENEEDLTNPNNRAGTVSIIDLRRGPAAMTQIEIPIPAAGMPFFPHDPQPETVRIARDSSFIVTTLQENNAVARIEVPRTLPQTLNPRAFRVTNFDLGLRTGLGLTGDRVGTGNCRSSSYDLSLRQEYTAAREPDGIALSPDLSFFVTADEDNLVGVNEQSYQGIPITQHGTRSVSVFDAKTGALLSDSGDTIEDSILALQLPQRCHSKGPEPEVVSVGTVAGRTLAVVSIERSDAITIHDVTNPRDIQLLDTVILNPGIVAGDRAAEFEPEGIELIPQRRQIVVSNPENGSMSLINLTAR